VRLLAQLGGESEHSFFTQRLASEKSETVAEGIRNALGDSTPKVSADSEDFVLKTIPEVLVEAPLPQTVLADLRTCFDEFIGKTAEEFAKNKFTPLRPDIADKFFEALQNFVPDDSASSHLTLLSYNIAGSFVPLLTFAGHPEFKLIHLVRWCLLLAGPPQQFGTRELVLGYQWREPLLNYQKAHKEPIDLRELAVVLQTLGLDQEIIGNTLLTESTYLPVPFQRSEPQSIWPYFAERLYFLEEAMGMKQPREFPRFWGFDDERTNAFKILKLFPRLPSVFVPMIWERALGKARTERQLAQECLERFPNKEEKILAALAGRQQDARFAAAQWLADLNYKDAIPALLKALAKEKSDVVKDEIIRALETLGMKLEEILDLGQLDRDAEVGLKKGIPKDLDWFPFSQLRRCVGPTPANQ
jgi:hypothetical protein